MRGAYKFCCKTSSPPPFLAFFSKISRCCSRSPRVPATKMMFGPVRYFGRRSVRYGAGNSEVRQAGGRPGSLATVGVIPFFDNDHPRTASARYHTLPSASPIRSPRYSLPTYPPIATRRPGFGVSANSSFFSRFLSLGGRDYWEAEEF